MNPTIVLIRHGETQWSKSGQHTGRTDIPLTHFGRERASAIAPRLSALTFGLVLSSPLTRARDTAHLAGLDPQDDPDLLEWDYGAWEGRTTAEIRAETKDPTWVVWDHQVPAGDTPGEQPEEVAIRAHRVIRRCQPFLANGESVAVVAHGHLLRILTATWLGLPATAGRLFALEAGALSGLGFERDQHVVSYWNT